MDALDILMLDHKKLRMLFQMLGSANQTGSVTTADPGLAMLANRPAELLMELGKLLSLHATIEENNFYPALASLPAMAELIKDSYHEHADVKIMLGNLAMMDPASEQFQQQMSLLRQLVEHHLDEEEQQLFTKVREQMQPSQLQALGLQLEQARVIDLPGVLISLPLQIQQMQQVMGSEPAEALAASPVSAVLGLNSSVTAAPADAGISPLPAVSDAGMAGDQPA